MISLIRKIPAAVLIAALTIIGTPALHAQSHYPERPIRLIVPFPPGGGNDILARAIQPKLAELLGQNVIIDNRAGAGGNLGMELASKAPADSYTIVVASNQVTINPAFQKLPFDIEKDFASVAQVASVPMVLTVNPAVPAHTVREFIALVKTVPGKYNYSTPGSGTPHHIAFEVFNHEAGVSVTHVPYKGTSPAIADLMGSQVQAAIATLSSVEPGIRSGKLRALAVTTPKRSQIVPDIPTIAETLPGFDVSIWYSVLAPAGTPRDILTRLSSAIAGTLQDPAVRERLARQGYEISYLNADQLDAVMKHDIARWKKTIQDIGGIQLD